MTPAARGPAAFAVAAATTLGTYVAAAALSLANLFVVARELGPVGRGDVVFLVTITTVAGYLGSLSVQEANANVAGTEPESRPGLATNSVLLSFACGGVAGAAVAALVAIVPAAGGEVSRTLLWLALAAVPLVVLRLYFHFLAQADYHFAITNVAWLVGPATAVAANTALALVDRLTVGAAFGAWVAGQLLGLAILGAHIHRHAGFGAPDLRLARRAVRFGTKAHLGRAAAVGHYRVDQWLVGALAGSRELGLYSVATAWAEVLSYLPGVLALVQRPDIVRATREEAGRLAARIFRVAILLTTLLCVAFVLAAPVLCVAILGERFDGAIDDLRVLTLAAFGFAAMELLGGALTAQRRPMLATAALTVAFIGTIALDALLVPEHGGLGAAVAAATASTAGGAVAVLIFARVLGGSLADLVPRLGDIPWVLAKVRGRVAGAAGG